MRRRLDLHSMAGLRGKVCTVKPNTLEDKESSLLFLNTNIEFHVFTKPIYTLNCDGYAKGIKSFFCG